VTRWLVIIINLFAYDICWTLTMFGAGRSWWWVAIVVTGLSVAGQLAISPVWRREAAVVLLGALVGVVTDAIGVRLGMFSYRAGAGVQFWIVFFALWANFGTVLRPSLSWMWNKPFLAALLGATGGPLAYWIGAKIGAIDLGTSVPTSLTWFSVQYAILTPAWMLAAQRVIGERGGQGPRSTPTEATPAEGRPPS